MGGSVMDGSPLFDHAAGWLPMTVASLVVLSLSLLMLLLRRGKSSTVASKKGSMGKAAAATAAVEEDPNKPRVRILYGTQTGTAERFSKQLAKDLRKKYGDSTVIDVLDVENYKAAERMAKEKLLVLAMATYGDGEPTDNAAGFFTWLGKEADLVLAGEKEPPLLGITYAVFGLGNKQYEHFNAVGKKAFKALGDLGASPLLRRGDGDDDGCIDDDFDKWTSEFYEALDAKPELMGAVVEQDGEEAPTVVAAYDVFMLPDAAKEVAPFPGGSGYTAHSPFLAKITRVDELHTPESDRSCVHVEIDLSGSTVQYEHGDHVAVFSQNSAAVVEEVATLLGVAPGAMFKLSRPAGLTSAGASLDEPPFSGPLSLRTALSYFADVLASPRKDALLALAAHTSDPTQADRLRQLGSHAGRVEYAEYVSKQHRSLLEVMRDFPSARPPLGVFFGSVTPRLQPRFYSISSSPKLHPKSVHVTCALVRDVMPTGRVHEGVCSTWMKQHGAGSTVPVFVRHSHFKLPAEPTTPIIMVGPGTGLAPFRGFLQERAALIKSGAKLGPAVLFFGCRNRLHDYIYEQELASYLENGAITSLHVAFSREEGGQGPKVYVQHHMEREGAGVLWPLLSLQSAHLYVCGDAKHMAKDVHRALLTMVQAGKGCTGTQAEAFVKEMQDAGRYQRDVW